MSIVRITYGLPRFALFVQICAALIYTPRPAFAQATDSSREQAQAAQSVSDTFSSSDQASEAQQQSSQQPEICGVKHLGQCLKLATIRPVSGLAHCVSRPEMRFGWCRLPPAQQLRFTTTHKHNRILGSTRAGLTRATLSPVSVRPTSR